MPDQAANSVNFILVISSTSGPPTLVFHSLGRQNPVVFTREVHLPPFFAKMMFTFALLALLASQETLAAPVAASYHPTKRLDVNKVLAAVLGSLPIGSTVNDLQSTLTSTEQDIADKLDVNVTQNAGAACADVTILFARGTDDPGNVGLMTGPAFFDAVKGQLKDKSLAVQGTNNYGANIDGFLKGGDKNGSQQL